MHGPKHGIPKSNHQYEQQNREQKSKSTIDRTIEKGGKIAKHENRSNLLSPQSRSPWSTIIYPYKPLLPAPTTKFSASIPSSDPQDAILTTSHAAKSQLPRRNQLPAPPSSNPITKIESRTKVSNQKPKKTIWESKICLTSEEDSTQGFLALFLIDTTRV